MVPSIVAVNDVLAAESCVDVFGDITRRLLILEEFMGVSSLSFVVEATSDFDGDISSFLGTTFALESFVRFWYGTPAYFVGSPRQYAPRVPCTSFVFVPVALPCDLVK